MTLQQQAQIRFERAVLFDHGDIGAERIEHLSQRRRGADDGFKRQRSQTPWRTVINKAAATCSVNSSTRKQSRAAIVPMLTLSWL